MATTIASMQVRLGAETSDFRRDMQRAADSAEQFSSDVSRVVGNTEVFESSGESAGSAFAEGFRESAASGLQGSSVEFRASGERAGRSFGEGASRSMTSRIGRSLMSFAKSPVLLVAGALVASTFAGAVVAGITTAIAGMGVIGLAYQILKEKPAIEKAVKSLKKTVKGVFRDAAKPMIGPLKRAMKDLEETAKDLKPQFRQMFKSVAESGATKSLTDGIDKLLTNLMPGFNKLMKSLGPAFKGLEQMMGSIGSGLGKFFKHLSTVSPEMKVALKDLGLLIEDVLAATGQLLALFARAYVKVRPLIEAIATVYRWLRDRMFPAVKFVTENMGFLFQWAYQQVTKWVVTMVATVIRKIISLATTIIGKIAGMATRVVGYFRELPDRAKSAMSALGLKIASVAASAGRSLLAKVGTFVGRAVGKIKGMPGRAARALGDLGGKLVSAGKALIGGFINGILSRIADVRDAASRIVSAARNFFPFSPAKEGPFSGTGYTTYSGAALIDGFTKGVRSRLPALRKELGGIGAGMPDFSARVSGVVRSRSNNETRVVLDVQGTDEEMKRLIRRMVRVDGRGNVQTAFGN